MPETTDPAVEPRLSWAPRCVRWCQTAIDGIARELVSKHIAPRKDLLLSTTCGGSFFEQLVLEFHRLDHYPATAAPPPVAATASPADKPSPPAAEAPAISPATEEYKTMVRVAFEEAERKYRAGCATWDDYQGLRKLLLPMYPREELYGVMLTLRRAFEDQATTQQTEVYGKMAPEALGPQASHAQMLAHALYLQEQVAKVETYRPHQELKRSYITFALFVSLAVTVFIEVAGSWAVLAYYSWRDGPPPRQIASHSWMPDPFPFVTLAIVLGALGATVSYQRRLQQSFDQDGSILNTTRYVGTGVGVKVTPIQGSIFAFVLLCICYSNLANDLAAGVLPKKAESGNSTKNEENRQVGRVDTPKSAAVAPAATPGLPTVKPANALARPSQEGAADDNAASAGVAGVTPKSRTDGGDIEADRLQSRRMIVRLFVIGPSDGVEFAKLLVFAFLAGFAERLVPDTLDRLTMKTRKDKN